MRTLEASYTRIDAIADGRLLDVSHLNRHESNPFPTFVSVGLFEACRRERPRKRENLEERLRQVITLPQLFGWLAKGTCGEFTTYYDSIRWLRYPLLLRVVVEPEEDYGRIVTVLLGDERLDFDVPRPPYGGSFFVM